MTDDRPETMKTQNFPALRSLPDRALDAWLRTHLDQSARSTSEQEIPAELLALVRSGNGG